MKKKIKGFSLHIMPFSEIRTLTISERVKKILKLVLENRVVILQGRLRVEEEIRLIEDTMAMVDHIRSFKGIELAVIEPDSTNTSFFFKIRRNLAKTLIGDSNAMTVIGPASIVKEIKKDPRKIEVLVG
ncbi:MAG: DUF2073 domain-containing protein [Nanoarchaeota archaeon]|nr:DUF2073 domain-containing protein [Nanoarchaeota archaeon]